MTNREDRLTLALQRQSAACLARVVPEVGAPFSQRQLSNLLQANAVRYGTAKGEWFLNAVLAS